MSNPFAGVPPLGEPERELLLLCARTALAEAQARRVDELLDEQLEWESLGCYARLHSVAPLLHHHLRDTSAYRELPTRARQRLFAHHQAAAYQNGHFAREARLLVEAFQEAGIDVIVARDVALLDLVYNDRTLRPLIDIDLLVPARQIDHAMNRLRELGYALKRSAPYEGIYRWSCPQFVFTASRDISVSVVVRSDAINWPRAHRFGTSGLWARAEPATVCGVRTLTLSPVDLAMYLCAQADDHGYFNRVGLDRIDASDLAFAPWANNRLIRFTDISEVVRKHRERLDWDLLVQRARQSALQEAIHTSLSLTNGLISPVAPRDVLGELRDEQRHRLRSWIFDGVAHEAGLRRAGIGRRLAGQLWMRGPEPRRRRLARLLAFVELVFPDRNSLSLHRGRRTGQILPVKYALHVVAAVGRAAVGYLRARAASHQRSPA